MKRYIKSDTTLRQGSYVADRNGKIYDIGMHVPSTTYLGRGYLHLAPTDAEFLLDQGLIDEDEAFAIALYNYEEFLEDEIGISDEEKIIPLHVVSQYLDYAEMKWAKKVRKIFMKDQYRTLEDINSTLRELPDFFNLQDRWYKYLQDNYIKISRFSNVVEFRISSNDGYDWNKVIIDKIILPNEKGRNSKTRYNIMRETDKGYKEYFYNAELNDILENDKVVLSSQLLERKIAGNRVSYKKKKFYPELK